MTEKTRAAAQARAEATPTDAPPPMPSDSMPADLPAENPATAQSPAPTGVVYSPLDTNKDLVDRLRARHMPSGASALNAGEIIKRRRVSFEIDGVECEPDMFVDDAGDYITFKVTLRALTSTQEIEALRGIKDATMAPMMMAKSSLYAINDKPIGENDRDFFWECLGPSRQICMLAFNMLGAASEAAMGKYLSTRSED